MTICSRLPSAIPLLWHMIVFCPQTNWAEVEASGPKPARATCTVSEKIWHQKNG